MKIMMRRHKFVASRRLSDSCASALRQQTGQVCFMALRLADLSCMKTKQRDLHWHNPHMAVSPVRTLLAHMQLDFD